MIIDPVASRSGNGHVVVLGVDSIEVRSVEAARGNRPWTRASLLADAAERRHSAELESGLPPRETDVPFATTPQEGRLDADDDGQARGRGAFE